MINGMIAIPNTQRAGIGWGRRGLRAAGQSGHGNQGGSGRGQMHSNNSALVPYTASNANLTTAPMRGSGFGNGIWCSAHGNQGPGAGGE